MKKVTVAAMAALLVLASSDLTAQEAPVFKSALHDFRVVTVAEGLVSPFSMTFTPEGDLLVAERPGRLRIIRKGVLLPQPVQGLPEIIALGRGARVVTWKEAERVLAGYPDGRADEGPTSGAPSRLGLNIAREKGWTAPEMPEHPFAEAKEESA